MPRLKKTLKPTSDKSINDFVDNRFSNDDEYKEEFKEKIRSIILKDVTRIKDCEEQDIVNFYIDEFKNQKFNKFSKDELKEIQKSVRHRLVKKYVVDDHFEDTIDAYFNAVKRESILYPMGESFEIDFLPENKDIFIKNNLKLVINTAKKYRNLGLPFEDLIQIGNEGLLKAWDKFDGERSTLKRRILEYINNDEERSYTKEDAIDIVSNCFSYSKLLDKTLDKIPENGFESKVEFEKWTKDNVKTATFTSVGFIWIRSMIVNELSKYSNIIRVPQAVKNVTPGKSLFINIDSINPYTEDNYADAQLSSVSNAEFIEQESIINNNVSDGFLQEFITKLLSKLDILERRVVMKRFGINMPFNMTISEIAENEGLSINTVNEIIASALKKLKTSIPENQIDILYEFIEE